LGWNFTEEVGLGHRAIDLFGGLIF
jgi:hypothetical protein